jgi:hypothetical protein
MQAIRAMMTEAPLPQQVQQFLLARFDQLPKLYSELSRTYESRFADRIAGSVEGMVRVLASKEAGPDAAQFAATLITRMRAMHDRYGVAVTLKPLPAAKPARKGKAA